MSIAESEERDTGRTVQAMRKRNGHGWVWWLFLLAVTHRPPVKWQDAPESAEAAIFLNCVVSAGKPVVLQPRDHFRQRLFLAWSQGLPPLKIAVHEEKILGGQNPGKQETRRAGPPGSAKAGMDGADGVGMPRRLCRRSGQGARHCIDPEGESETAVRVALPSKKPLLAAIFE